MYVLDQALGRRRFLKLAGTSATVAAAGAVASGCTTVGSTEHTIASNPAGAGQWGREAGTWIPSCCNMCGGQSGVLVHVVNGTVEKIEPNPWNPNNYSNISSDFFAGYCPLKAETRVQSSCVRPLTWWHSRWQFLP